MERLVFFDISCGTGMDCPQVHDCQGMSDSEIDFLAWEFAVELANSYGTFWYECDLNAAIEDGEVEDDGNQFTDNDLEYHWEDYVPEKHDMHCPGGGSFR